MNVLIRYWKKILYFLITGSTSVFIAACYGVPYGFYTIQDWIIRIRDENNEPIPGLKVSMVRYNYDESTVPFDTFDIRHTDSLGCAEFHLHVGETAMYQYEAVIQDIDGEANGVVQDTVITPTNSVQSITLRTRE